MHDERVLSPERLTITARRDLRISRRSERGEDFYFVEDPLRGKFFRLGLAEHAFFTALDGSRTLAETASAVASHGGSNALTQDEAVQLAEWLVTAGLASNDIGTAARSGTAGDSRSRSRGFGWNLWSIRITLGSPDRMLERFDPLGRILFGRMILAVWSVVVGTALLSTMAHWKQLTNDSPIEWGWRGALTMGLVWCVLKIWHELGHALACRRFGGNVGNVGLAFVLGMPSPFVDVSSIRRVPERWPRIVVSLAGIYCELFAAGLAMLVWSWSSDVVVQRAALTVAVVASIGSLAFNLNPLMRFDGYFALSDFCELPNLAATAREDARRLLRRRLLGLDEPKIIGRASRPWWVAWYGIAAAAWRWVVTGSLTLLAIAMLGVFGTILISVPALFAWIARRADQRATAISRPVEENRNRVRQFGTWAAVALVVAVVVVFFDPRMKELCAVVDYDPLDVVRVETAGFVRRVYVADGEHVEAGQKLAELENVELVAELARAELAIEQSLVRSRMHRLSGAIAEDQAEQLRRNVLEAEHRELQRRRERLTLTATASGTIVSNGLDRATGRRLEQGDEFVAIGDAGAKMLQIAVPERLAAAIADADGRTGSATIVGRRKPVVVRLTSCDPKASNRLLHPALSVEHGGATIVRRRNARPDESDAEDRRAGHDMTIAETIEPCFTMHLRADDDALRDIAAGRTATVAVRIPWRTAVGDYWSRASAWLHEPRAE